MTPSPSAFSTTASGLAILSILLVPSAAAGVALINTGLCRSRNAAHTMLLSFVAVSAAAVAYSVCGFAWQGYPGLASHAFQFAGRSWDWIAAGPFLMRGVGLDGSPASLAAWYGLLSVGVAAQIPLGAGAERWKLTACAASTALLAGWTYPLFAHAAWGGGWLRALGMAQGLGQGYLDAGGAGTIHAVGGVTALAIAWTLGPRRGKYAPDGAPAAMPGHNGVLVLLGCFAAWLGWLGLNSAGTILFVQGEPGLLPRVGINTTLSGAGAVLASLSVTRARFGKPDASLAANGWVAGLVACSAGCPFFPPVAAVLVGAFAGGFVAVAVPWIESKLRIDDPGGAIAVHGLGGLWGILAVGFFAKLPASTTAGGSNQGQWLAQLVGFATIIGLVLPLSYTLNKVINIIVPQRVPWDAEHRGMDLYELGSGAYPEFMTHTDEFIER